MTTPLKPARPRPGRPTPEQSRYTFGQLRALPHLPDSATSLAFLRRLRDDPGVVAVMRKHRLSVGALAEMEPAGNTTVDGKTLGRNTGRGQVIEVRLRTDWYVGWRDYKTVRRTLCHELAHNVHDEHDRDFWNLTGLLEREVEAADWTTGGRPLTDRVFYNPPDERVVDAGGWEGGSFTLGGGGSGGSGGKVVDGDAGKGLSMREVMARAAEERIKKLSAAASVSRD